MVTYYPMVNADKSKWFCKCEIKYRSLMPEEQNGACENVIFTTEDYKIRTLNYDCIIMSSLLIKFHSASTEIKVHI